MTKKWLEKRLAMLFDGDTVYGPIHFFLLPTLAYSIGFVFFSTTDGIQRSSLFTSISELGGHAAAVVWGAVLLAVMLGSVFTMRFKRWYIAHTTAFVGFLAWLFATLMYIQDGNYMLSVGVTMPNMLFWIWLYIRVKENKSTAHRRP